jgi:FtsZ-binding cell division protein ZapB
MRALRIFALLQCAFALCALGRASAQDCNFTPATRLSLCQYTSELERLGVLAHQAIDDKTVAQTAIDELHHGDWTVDAEGQSFTIKTGWLTDEFEKLQKNPTASVRDEIVQRLGTMKADAVRFQKTPADPAAAQQKLKEILARSEFSQVHGATWWDRMWDRIETWIYRNLSKMFGSSTAPTIGHLFVWTLVGAAVLALAYFVFRTIRQNARLESIMPEVLPVSAKQWRVWLKEAREAGDRGQWRDAVHLAYWGGISFLEESGMWRPDQARTPREYLRLLAPDSQHRGTLKTLTRRLEVTWYGKDAAGPESFSETVANLEELGCRD